MTNPEEPSSQTLPSNPSEEALKEPVCLFDPTLVEWFRRELLLWHAANTRTFPWRYTESPYEILIAEVLLQATFSGKVVPIYLEFVRRYPNPQELATALLTDIQNLIRPLGLQHRAQKLIALGEALVSRHAGEIPADEHDLLALPGVGPYTSGAVQSFAFGKRAGIPDTNVVRVLQRFFGVQLPTGGYRGSPSKTIRAASREIVPETGSRVFNLALLDFGALVCTFHNPKCHRCPLTQNCAYFHSISLQEKAL